MTTSFEITAPSASPAHDGKATWSDEDRDYVWLKRGRTILPFVMMIPFAAVGSWILMRGGHLHERPDLMSVVAIVTAAMISGPGNSVLLAFADRRIERRYHYSRRRHLYATRAGTPSIQEAMDRLDAVPLSHGQRHEQRRDALAPLRFRVGVFRGALRLAAIAQWALALVTVGYALSDKAAHAGQVGSALGISAALFIGGLLFAPIWQLMIYDVPARWNPMAVEIALPHAMASVLEDACEDDGQIWMVDHKVVPRGLFKTPFGALLLGDPWSCAPMPFGLWAGPAHLCKEMSGEIHGYYQFTEFFERVLADGGASKDAD